MNFQNKEMPEKKSCPFCNSKVTTFVDYENMSFKTCCRDLFNLLNDPFLTVETIMQLENELRKGLSK